jgi:hypothetical protein
MVVSHKYPITLARRSSSFASLAAPAKCGNKIAMGADVTAGAFRLAAVRSPFYSVADGVLTMRDENGTPTGKNCGLGPSTTTAS